MRKTEDIEGLTHPEDVFRASLRHPYGQLEGKGEPIPKHAIVAVRGFDEETKRRHNDHMMAAHHKFMANHFRKKSHKK